MRLLVTCAVAAILFTASITTAQEDPALVLAISCVAEIGPGGRLDECSLMWSVLLAKTTIEGLPGLAKRYNSVWRVRPKSKQWILNLRPDGAEPNGFPQHLNWERYRSNWKAMYTKAIWFFRDTPPHPCPAAKHYGGPVDGKAADDEVPTCWKRQWCGHTKPYYQQAYYDNSSCPARRAPR